MIAINGHPAADEESEKESAEQLRARLVSERRQAEEHSRRQAVSDELTGLANYRCLMNTLEGEIKRAQRAGRAFALLLVDMDGLKEINDGLGHLVGNRAL